MNAGRKNDDRGPARPGAVETKTMPETGTDGPVSSVAQADTALHPDTPEQAAAARTVLQTGDRWVPPELSARSSQRYERLSEHARGGLGQIWRAHDRTLDRTVALKALLKPSYAAEARFVREAMITARLEHPSIVAVHDAGRDESGQPFYTMKLVAGRSLADQIASTGDTRTRLSLLPHVIDMTEAVAYAHSRRIIHRDLKPSNVLVGDYGETVVVDWGLAKELGDDDLPAPAGPYRTAGQQELTRVGSVMGTPGYMPPEQARGDEVDERADVYALGASLYHLLSGDAPSGSESPPADLSTVAPDVPTDLVAIVRRAMERDPERRYPTANELAEDLRRFQTGKLVSVHGYSAGELVRRWIRRHRAAVAATCVALIVVVVVGAVSVTRIIEARGVADRRLTDSLVDRGRRALLSGDFRASATQLSRAYERGADDAAVRTMLPLAMRPFSSELATLIHPSRAWEVNYSSDGRLLLVTTETAAYVWDADSNQHLQSLVGHTAPIQVARLSRDGTVAATGSEDRTARIWSVADGVELRSLAHDSRVDDVAFSPDNAWLATGTVSGRLRIWNRSGELSADIPAHETLIARVLFSPDGQLVATAAADGLVKLWRVPTGELVHSLSGHREAVRNLAFDRAGTRLVSAGLDHQAIVWDVAQGARLLTLAGHENPLIGVAFNASDSRIITSGHDTYVNIWNAADGALLRSLRGHDGAIYWARFVGDSSEVVTASWDGTARVWDARQGVTNAVFAGHEGPVVWGALRPDGERLATTSWDGSVRIWNAVGRRELARISGGSGRVRSIATTPDGRRGVVCWWDGKVRRVRTSGTNDPVIDTGSQLTACALAPDGEHLAVGRMGGQVELWSLRDGAMTTALGETEAPVLAIDFSADGDALAVGDLGGVLTRWTVAGKLIARVEAHDGPIHDVAFGPGAQLLTASADQSVKLWNAGSATPALERRIHAHKHTVASARFAPGGERFVTASYDGSARIWDASTGTQLAELKGHAGEVLTARFHPGGDLVVTASAGGGAAIWDVADARPIARFHGHDGKTVAATFASGGNLLWTAGADDLVKLWDVAPERRSPEVVRREVDCLLAGSTDSMATAPVEIMIEPCRRAIRRPPAD